MAGDEVLDLLGSGAVGAGESALAHSGEIAADGAHVGEWGAPADWAAGALGRLLLQAELMTLGVAKVELW